jgi:putative glycosyltransferase (TIGR04372 family)
MKRKLVERIISRYRRAVLAGFQLLFRLLPLRIGFAVIFYMAYLNRRAANFIIRAYAPLVTKALIADPNIQLCSSLTSIRPVFACNILLQLGAFKEVTFLMGKKSFYLRSSDAVLLMSSALFELSDFDRMADVLSLHSHFTLDDNYNLLQQEGHSHLLFGREDMGLQYLKLVSDKRKEAWIPHQNISARPPNRYFPNKIDLQSGNDGLLYDAYNYLGQRVTHVGRGDLGVRLYAAALKAQERLYPNLPKISEELAQWLDEKDIALSDVRILPWEWSTQIGHLGMLDILLRMRALGWWTGKAIVLTHKDKDKIANSAFLSLFKEFNDVTVVGPATTTRVAAELFSLQRYFGLGFNAWKDNSAQVVAWQEAGAIAMRQWDEEKRCLPMREAIDSRYLSLSVVRESIDEVRAEWGMNPDDWYVCLHMRDPAFYGEISGSGQTHRNSSVEGYLDAVRYITKKGGWVVKLGGPHSLKLPKMDRVIDYSRSRHKSELMDLFLMRGARLFIGTTSGLTNIAISFGIPSALVNCITTDAQLWNRNVRFVVKPIQTAGGTILSQRQLTTTPWRWRMFSAELLRRDGATQLDNSTDEILEVVKEVESIADGRVDDYAMRFPDAAELIDQWKNSLGLPHFYGSAQPSLYFLNKRKAEFLD